MRIKYKGKIWQVKCISAGQNKDRYLCILIKFHEKKDNVQEDMFKFMCAFNTKDKIRMLKRLRINLVHEEKYEIYIEFHNQEDQLKIMRTFMEE